MRRPDLTLHVYREITRQRQAHGLPVATPNAVLVRAAHAHNRRMAAAGRLDHQLPGEPSLGVRLRTVGYRFAWCGENIGVTGTLSREGAVDIQERFYNERPPNDAHRRIVLSATARQVGVDIWAVNGRLWLTEIFARPL